MYPRRYVSEAGIPLLIGLTIEETREFEQLDSKNPLGSDNQPPHLRDRLLNLYLKHQAAYDRMMMDQSTS